MAPERDVDLGADRSVDAMRRRCHAMLDAAYAAGVRYVDAARSYGLAELFLNSWWSARGLSDDALVAGSKWGYTYTGAWQLDAPIHEVKDLSVDTLLRQASESLGVLGPRVALFQIHYATLESGVLFDRAVLAALVCLRSRGLCVGLTVTGPRQGDAIRRALEIRMDGVSLFQTVQGTWNLLEPSAGRALADAHTEGCGVIVKEALANGRLTDRCGGPELRDLRARAAALGVPVETIVMASAIAQPWADVVLSGAVTCEQLRAHVAALDLIDGWDELTPIAEPPDAYWRRRGTLPWS